MNEIVARAEAESLPIVNEFCSNLHKLNEIVSNGGKGSEEWGILIRTMRNQYVKMFWKHQKQMERWRQKLTDLGFYDREADLKIDISDIKEEEVKPEGRFDYAKPIVSEKG